MGFDVADDESARAPSYGKTLISRDEAMSAGLKRYFTGQPCRLGHISERNVGSNNECQECKRQRDSAYAARRRPEKAEYDKQYRIKNAARICENKRRWSLATVERRAENNRTYRQANAERLARQRELKSESRRKTKRLWDERNRDWVRAYAREYDKRAKSERPNYRLACALRARLAQAVRSGAKSGSAVQDLGCSIDDLRGHLEAQFAPGMSWGNWGRQGWQIDHRKPLASFDLSNPDDLRQACHYTNLQPLWAGENASKGAKTTWEETHKARAGWRQEHP